MINYINIFLIIYKLKTIKATDLDMKYILQWTSTDKYPFVVMGKGQENFLSCPINNCYVTSNKFYLNNLKHFDAILFNAPDMKRKSFKLPKTRSIHQRYIFTSMEPSFYYPIRDKRYDNFFNWTWTYRLDSDIYLGYFIIKNKQGKVVGPKKVMHWLNVKDMKPIDDNLKVELRDKKKAAAWFVSNCDAPNKRYEFVKQLKAELAKYKMTVDIYGGCGPLKCPREMRHYCWYLVETLYYFYLAFENSFNEDYVTEKVLTALQNSAVPVVYGGANYSRFLPDGAYLDARKLGVEELVRQMVEAIYDPEKYSNFFKWRNHYTYDSFNKTYYLCNLCKMINTDIDIKVNDTNIMRKLSFYTNFRAWWNAR